MIFGSGQEEEPLRLVSSINPGKRKRERERAKQLGEEGK
jgi:hypothetical protein